jgi:2'-5' RNA ligase
MSFLGIHVQHDVARLLHQIDLPENTNKVPTDEMHSTVLYFPKFGVADAAKVLEPINDIAKNTKPFLLKLDKVSCFPASKSSGNKVPIIIKLKSQELHDIHNRVKKDLDKIGIDYAKNFKDYQPHITLAYADKEIDDFEVDNMEFCISEMVLWAGLSGDSGISVNFSFKPPEKHPCTGSSLQSLFKDLGEEKEFNKLTKKKIKAFDKAINK